MKLFDAHAFLANAPTQSGVYQMLDEQGNVIYVGKAKNLKARLSSYFQDRQASAKTLLLVSKIANIKTILTHTENEALLLEQTLIKEYRPRYNVLLRDDKSYPYLYLSDHLYPALRFIRGHKLKKGRYFGPYPSSTAVRETLDLLHKIFQLRSCRDPFFANRSRPCLEYQIKRCSGPCVGLVSPETYQEAVENATLFLSGKRNTVIEKLTEHMQEASKKLHFEEAMRYRDLIKALQGIRQKQHVTGLSKDKAFDVILILLEAGTACLQKLVIREGDLIGNQSYFMALPPDTEQEETLSAFLAQHYLAQETLPDTIYVNIPFADQTVLASVLREKAHHSVNILHPKRGNKREWLSLAELNATQALREHQLKHTDYEARFSDLEAALQIPSLQTIECFDMSHTQGEATIGACVVFARDGAQKKAYRRWNIEGITPGDDYAAMHQALTRRYQLYPEEGKAMPDLLLIDGGKGQLSQAEAVFRELKIAPKALLGISKGPGRKSGLETIFLNSAGILLDMQQHPLAFLLLQEVRDEAHRFAITGHRRKRDKARVSSFLEEIEGIGPTRRQRLLRYFGGLQGLRRATLEQIHQVPGMSPKLAEKVYQALHSF